MIMRHVLPQILWLGTCLLTLSCTSPGVNPTVPRTNTGYVDFYSNSDTELYWAIERFDTRNNAYKEVFSKMNSIKGGFLRLAFPAGHGQFRISFLNVPVVEPAMVAVDVKDGLVTPVLVELTQAGQSTVISKQTTIGASVSRRGRRTKITDFQAVTYRASASAQPEQPYRLKEQMPYFKKPTG
jgi:hypothetical protein